jgi:CRP-like cAMP-binding protein
MLPEAEREALLAAGPQYRFSDDQILVLQGDDSAFFYVLTEGLVKVVGYAQTGGETIIALRSRGDLIGEFAVVDNKPYEAGARAIGPVTAIKISRAAWTRLVEEHPALVPAFTNYLVVKMRASTERQVAERVWDARQRLAQVLYQLADEYGVAQSGGALRLPVTQSELGQLADVAVATVERLLAEFRKKGVISTAYRAVVVRDMEYLARIRFAGGDEQNPLGRAEG